MVCTFFIISGFVLTTRGLSQIRRKQTSLLKSVSSAAFRRMFRLWLPIIAVSFIYMVLTRSFGHAITDGGWGIRLADSWTAKLDDWQIQVRAVMNPLSYRQEFARFDFMTPVWTIRK